MAGWQRFARTVLLAALVIATALYHQASAADYVTEPIAEAVQLNAPPKVDASGLTAQGVVSQAGSFDSNPLLLVTGAKSLYGSTTAPELILKDNTPDLQANADTTIDANVFNQSLFNSVDFHSIAGIQKANENWSLGIQENTDIDTTRTSELSSFGLTTRPFGHTGFQLAPQVSFSPTDIDKITLLAGYATSQYQSSVFSDYDVYSLTPTYVHNFDPRNAGVFAIQAQQYQTTDNTKTATSDIGPSIGWITAVSPQVTAKGTVGVQTSQQTGTGTPSRNWTEQYIFSGDITYRGQQDTLKFLASRSDYPLGNGTEALLTSLSLGDARRLNDTLLLNVTMGYQSSDYQSGAAGDFGTQLLGTAGLIYQITDTVNLTGTYQYRYETLSGISGKAEDNLFTVALVYRLNALSIR